MFETSHSMAQALLRGGAEIAVAEGKAREAREAREREAPGALSSTLSSTPSANTSGLGHGEAGVSTTSADTSGPCHPCTASSFRPSEREREMSERGVGAKGRVGVKLAFSALIICEDTFSRFVFGQSQLFF